MTSASASSLWLSAVPFVGLGLASLVAGAILLRRGLVTRLRGNLVDAEVVHREVHAVPVAARRAPDGDAAATVTPHVRYRDASGHERTARFAHQVRQRLRSERYRLRYPLGARVRVRIDPERPEVAHEDAVGPMLVFPVLLVAAGLLMALLGLAILFG